MSFRRRTYRVAAPSACERSAPEGRLNDRRGRLLLVKLEAARLRTSVHPLPALRAWLDSWDGLGAVVTGMERQGYDASSDTPKAGAPRPFTGTTRRGLGLVRC
jgi:hypothetical protein